jgi:hypothetical protein
LVAIGDFRGDRRRGERAVEAADRLEVGVVSGQVEHAQTAETESDRSHGVTLDGRQRAEHVDDSEQPVAQGVPIPQ